MKIHASELTYLSEILSEYKDDLETFWDTLDGETNVMDMVGSGLEDLVTAEGDEAKLDHIILKYTQRRDAVRSRKEAIKRSLKIILLATQQKKIPHSLATITLRDGSQSVLIDDQTKIPTQLCKTTLTPDKAAIKKLLQAGEVIDGAVLNTGPQSISIRMK